MYHNDCDNNIVPLNDLMNQFNYYNDDHYHYHNDSHIIMIMM